MSSAKSNRFNSRRSLLEWLYISLLLCLLGGYLAYSLLQDHIRIDFQERERLTKQARVVADNLERQLHATNLALASVLSEIPEWRKDGWKLSVRHLKALSDAMPGVLTMFIIDAKGTIVAADKPALVGQNVAKREYFVTVQRYPNPSTLYVSVPFLTSRGNFTMNLARLVQGPEGRFDGMVIAALDPDEFTALLNSVIYSADTNALLIHGDGMLFLSAPKRKNLVGFDQGKPDSFFTRQLQSDRQLNVFTGTSYALGDDSMVAMATIQPAALAMDKPLVAAVGRDMNALFADWKHEVLKTCGLFGAVALSLLLGLVNYQRRRRATNPAVPKH